MAPNTVSHVQIGTETTDGQFGGRIVVSRLEVYGCCQLGCFSVDCNPFLPFCAAMSKYMVLRLAINLCSENICGIRTKDLSLFLDPWSFNSPGKYRGFIAK